MTDASIMAAWVAVKDGEAILAKAHADFNISTTVDAGPMPDSKNDHPEIVAPVWKLSDEMADIIRTIINSNHTGRGVLASVGLVALRERYEVLNPKNLPDPIRSWEGFAARYVPLPADRVAELIGRMVHAGGLMCCTTCGIGTKSACGCGAPYVGTHRWAMPVAPEPQPLPNALPKSGARSGRKSIGDKPLTSAEKQARYRARKRAARRGEIST